MREPADAVSPWWARLPGEVAAAGGALPARLLVLALALAVNVGFYLPDVPAPPGGAELPGIDKLVHVGVFALTTWAAGRVLAPRRRFPIGWVVLAMLAHAVVIELLQAALLPDRSADPADIVADLAGTALGLLAWWAEKRWRAARTSPPREAAEDGTHA